MESLLIKTAELTARFLAKQLTPALRIESIWENEKEIKSLAGTVEYIGDVLSDIHDKQFKEASIKNGYKRLRSAFLDAEDFLDRVETLRKKREAVDAQLKEEKEDIKKIDGKLHRPLARCHVKMKSISNKMQHGFSKYNPANAMKDNNEIEEIKKALEAISKNLKDFGLMKATIEPDVTHNARGTSSRVDATEIIGREQDQSEIVNLLLNSSDDQKAIRAVSIVGMGGMGKSTLAQLVFNDIKSRGCKFDLKLWASDCKKFKLEWLLKKWLLSINWNTNYLNHEDPDYLRDLFVEKIRGKKVFLVLDDVEVEDAYIWDHLRLLLKEGNMEESRILVTTRSKEVASRIGANNTIYQLNGLSEEDSQRLFERCAFLPEKRDDENLIEIGKDIVKRCVGVPLAIKVIGSYLRTKNRSTWEYVKDCGLKEEDDYIIPILKISYDGLDSTLKQCFSLCALCPKKFAISSQVLSNIWITNVGFKAKEGITLQEICNDKLKILCERFFLEETRRADGSYLKMHDLMHDLSRKVGGEEMVVVDLKSTVNPNKLVLKENVRHLTLDHGLMKNDGTSTFDPSGRRLRTFLQVNTPPSYVQKMEILNVDKLVTACPFLRVLDIRYSRIGKLTDSIGKLIHLRYLDISGNEFETLPDSVTELINLRYLNLEWCNYLTCLPDRMDLLTSLEELNLSSCFNLEQLPTSIVKLANLKNLGLNYRNALAEVLSSMGALTPLCDAPKFKMEHSRSESGEQLRELGHVLRIKRGHLQIYVPSNTALKGRGDDGEAYLVNKEWLRRLTIVWEDKREEDMEVESEIPENHINILAKLQPPPHLEKFCLGGYQGMTFPPWVSKGGFVSVLPNLVQMRLLGCGKCRYLPPLSRLPCLRSLYLEDLRSLEYIEEENNTASFCPCLEELELHNLPELKGWCRGLDISGHQQSLMLPSFPRLNSMHIVSCSNLRVWPLLFSFVKVFDSSQTASLSLFDEILRDNGSFTLSFKQEIDKHSLSLIISDFNSTESTPTYMDEAFREMSDRLTRLTIKNCSGLKTLPRELPHLTALKELVIKDCCDFTWEEDDFDEAFRGMSDRLTHLTIQKCSRLKTLLTGLQHLTALQELVIEGCYDFTWEEDDYDEQSLEHQQTCSDGKMSRKPLESLQVLKLIDLPMMVRLPKWIQLATSLTELTLKNLPKMETLPEWIQILKKLQKLDTNLTLPICLHSTFEKKKYYTDYYYYVRIEATLKAKE